MRLIHTILITGSLLTVLFIAPHNIFAAVSQESINLLTEMYNKVKNVCTDKLDQAKAKEQEFGSCAVAKINACIQSTGYKNREACASSGVSSCRYIIDDFISGCAGSSPSALPTVQSSAPTKILEKKEETKLEACLESLHLTRDPKTKKCVCGQLYSRKEENTECIFSGGRGLSLDSDTYDKFQEIVEKLEADQGEVFEGKTSDGKMIRIGVLRLPDSGFVFTSDGKNYYDNPKDVMQPGLLTKLKASYSNLTRAIRLRLGLGTYIGKDTTGNVELQQDRQLQLDASNDAFKNLQDTDKNDPVKRGDTTKEIFEKHYKRMSQILGEKWDDLVIEETKNATGIDIDLIKKLLAGDFTGIALDQLKQIFSPTVAAEAVHTLAKELRNDNFGNAAHLYIRERQSGKAPAQIFALMSGGQLPELDFATSIKGVGLLYARGSLFMAYEEAYQRYLLSTKLK